jgi:adenine-specific DNA-methyltransferase
MPSIQFKGKTFVQNHHLAVKYHQLVPKKKLSLTDKVSLHDNLIIHGDNLKALKALLPTYGGKIKCVCIDPPYNTGNENWVYNDNVNSPMIQEWLGSTVDKEDLTRHDKWLCLMMPRLKLLRELLSENGAIFVFCDDNEQHRLRLLMDEIFGEANFVANVIWQHSIQGKGYTEKFSVHHNYLVIYQKASAFALSTLARTEEDNKNYSNPDNDPNGDWRTGDIRNALYRRNLIYDVKTPSGKTIKPPANGWRFKEETMLKKITAGQVVFSADETRLILKIYLKDVHGRVPETIWFGKEAGTTRDGKATLKELFGGDVPFETPKPVEIIKRILKLSTNENDVILDSFAGSGTTAHAVLELNQEEGSDRKFILVEMEDYADSITAERVRMVIKGVKTAKDEALRMGLGGSFSYFELGDPIEMESLLSGKILPDFKEFARYLFYTATGEEFVEESVDEKTGFIGDSKNYEVYLFYKPDLDWLKANALTLDLLKGLPRHNGKKRLVFAPTKYVDDHTLSEFRVDFCQLPYEIYRLQK